MIETVRHFKILEPLGRGPLGDVYRARDTRVGRTVAVTVVADAVTPTPALREQFLRDAKGAAAVSHPNVVLLYESGEDEGRVYLVHEFVRGQTLKALVQGRPLNPRRAIELGSQIADALADAHAAGVAHGAVGTARVMVTSKGHAKVADLGLASWMTAGSRVGASGGQDPHDGLAAGCRADVFSLGEILFEMLTGRMPSAGARVPSVANRSVPREIDQVVGRAFAAGRGRDESAATIAFELRLVGARLDVRLESVPAAAPARTAWGRSYGVWLALGLAIAAAALWWLLRSAVEGRPP